MISYIFSVMFEIEILNSLSLDFTYNITNEKVSAFLCSWCIYSCFVNRKPLKTQQQFYVSKFLLYYVINSWKFTSNVISFHILNLLCIALFC